MFITFDLSNDPIELIYHNYIGHEFVTASDSFVNLPQTAHKWLDAQDIKPNDLRAELQRIIETYETGEEDETLAHELSLSDAQTILACLETLKSFEQNPADHIRCVKEMRDKMDPSQKILGCACCGEVHGMLMDRIAPSYKSKSGFRPTGYEEYMSFLSLLRVPDAENRKYEALPYPERRIISIFPSHTLEGNIQHLTFDHRYYVHEEFLRRDTKVESTKFEDCYIANLCYTCHNDLLKIQPPKIPRFSIKNGFDYGNIERLRRDPSIQSRHPRTESYRDLTVAETMSISIARPYANIIKVSKASVGGRRLKLQGHMITMPFGGGSKIAEVAPTLPLFASEIKQRLRIIFVGAASFNQVRTSLLLGLRNALVGKDIVLERLRLYKTFNEEYKDIVIAENVSTNEWDSLQTLPHSVRNQMQEVGDLDYFPNDEDDREDLVASVISNRVIVRMNDLVTSREGMDIAQVMSRTSEGDDACVEAYGAGPEELNERIAADELALQMGPFLGGIEPSEILPTRENEGDTEGEDSATTFEIDSRSFLISSDGLGAEENTVESLQRLQLLQIEKMVAAAAAVRSIDGEEETKDDSIPAPLLVPVAVPIIPTTQDEDFVQADAGQANTFQAEVNPAPPIINVAIPIAPGDEIPLNEFTQNKRIMLHSFPELFLLGKGVSSNGSCNKDWVLHLNRQFTNKFATNKEFQFLIFNQQQRHEAARVVAKKVKNNPTAMRKASEKLNDDGFGDKLRAAIQDPTGDEAKSVLKDFSPLLQGMGKQIPHTAAARSMVITHLYALMMLYGYACNFLTFAPDETNERYMLRFCYGLVNNNAFPAKDAINYNNNEITFKEVNE